MLIFITSERSTVSPADQIKRAIAGGCRWVQIRMPNATDEEIGKVVDEIKPLCLEKGVFLLLHDRVELVKTLDVGGVFLERKDILPSKARLTLGPAAVIGVAVNTIEDIISVRSLDLDFLAMCPFAATSETKEGEKVLGLDGVQDLALQMEALEINIGHVAMGGIKPDNIAPLMQAGANGIAISDYIACAPDITVATRECLDQLLPFTKEDHMPTPE